jgi:hypothetical protein
LCAACTRPDPAFGGCCPPCGHRQLSTRSCTRCTLRQRLQVLLAGHDGDVRAELRGLHDNLASSDRPNLVLAWLNKACIAELLRELGAGQRVLSHAGLDELPAGKPIEHMRAILVATGTLPPRDEHLARLERWVARSLAECDDPGQRQLLHHYAVWHLLRRLRQRNNGRYATYSQVVTVKRHISAAIALLDGLGTRGRALADAHQADLDTWLTSDQAHYRRDAGHFVRWAQRKRLTSLEFPATRWHGPARTIDTEARWAQARWLLHDHTVNPVDRVAGLLVLLYAQTPAAVSRLTLEHAQTTERAVGPRLGREPIALHEPLAGLAAGLVARRSGHAALGDQATSPWLFPGGRPGQPISAYQLAERMRRLGLPPAQSRTTALFGLATELPAAVLARLLGIHIKVAVEWQHASAGDWTTYAADYSHRKPAPAEDTEPAPRHASGQDAFRQFK